MRRSFALACTLAVILTALVVQAADAQPNVTGQWSVLPYTMPINPIHVGLMRTGKILVVSGTQNDPTVTTSSAAVYDPATGAATVQTIPWDLFCNGFSWMPDGRALIAGGNLQYNPFRGIKTATAFDPITEKFIQVQDMARGRWYPSVTGLADGRMMTFSGWLDGGGTNTAVEIYTNPDGWSPENYAPFIPALYPWLHLLPDGRIFMAGAGVSSAIFDPASGSWQAGVATMNYPNERTYGSSVLLPLSAADNWRARIMIMGGDNPATDSVEIIDLSQPSPSWRTTNPMSGPRIDMDAVILPTGKILALGGSGQHEATNTATLNADLFDPATETWTPAGTMNMARLYHSVALLLPDGTVWAAGSNPTQGTWENRMEIYKPAYLFNASGGPATRPTITAAPSSIGYGGSFQVSTPNAANIASVALIRNGANTHAFDMDQRMISLAFTKGSGQLTVSAPPNANIAPPGYYMLFIVDTNGVPSVAPFVRVAGNPSNQPPKGSITAPSGDLTVRAGEPVTFSGSGSDPDGSVSAYRWIFPGGSPATSTSPTPGSVTFSTPGTYYVSLTVTDNQGMTDPSPPVRVITVQSTALTASFTSPADGATVSGNVDVGMAASGASGSSNTFTLTLDGNTIFTNTTAETTQTYTWATTGVADGTHTLGLTVRDATGTTATATRTVAVNNNAQGTLKVTFPNINPGQTVQGTVPVQIAVTGTSGTNNRFTVLVDGVQQTVIASNATTVTWNWDTTTVSNGSRTITANVQDATGNTGSGFVYVQVQNASSLQVFITQPSDGATVSGTAVWTTMWVNGAAAGTKTYTLSIGAQTLSTGTDTSSGPVTLPWNSTQVSNGTQALKATVRDSNSAVGSITISVNVQNAGTLGASFSSPAQGATVSGAVTVGMVASGGTAPYTYTLTIDGTQVASGGSASYSWNTLSYSNASHTLGLTVRDNKGATASATRTVTVQNGGTALTAGFSAPADGATVNGSVSVGMTASGGTAPYTYTLTVDGGQVASSASNTYTWNTTTVADGNHTLGLTVRDSTGATATASRTVTVQNTSAGTLIVYITQPASGATVSGTVWVTMWVDNAAAGTKTYTLTAAGQQVASGTDTSSGPVTLPWVTTNSPNGATTLTASVRDPANNTGTRSIPVTVQNAGSNPLTAGFSSPAAGATVSGSVSVGMTASGGTAPYTYTLTIDGAQVASSGANTYTWNTTTYSNAAHTLGLTVRDSTGATATASRTVTVQNTGPASLTAGFSAPTDGATVSGSVGVGMTASGGTAPYTYTLTVDGGQVASSASNTYTWNTTSVADGNHTLGLTVRDSTGATATTSRSVTVQNASAGTIVVWITQPASGATVSGTVWVTIWLENAAAGTKTFTLTAAGQTVASGTDTSSGPVTLPWVTTNSPNGATTLTATVRDPANNTGTRTIPVTVANP